MSDIFTAFAERYAELSGADAAQVQQATMVFAGLFADAVGRRDLGDYGFARARELEPQVGTGPAASNEWQREIVRRAVYEERGATERVISGNETAHNVTRDREGWY